MAKSFAAKVKEMFLGRKVNVWLDGEDSNSCSNGMLAEINENYTILEGYNVLIIRTNKIKEVGKDNG